MATDEEKMAKARAAGWALWKTRDAEEILEDWHDSEPETAAKDKEAKKGLRK